MTDSTTLPPRPVRTTPPKLTPVVVPDFDSNGGPPINPAQIPHQVDYARWARLEAINRAERLEREHARSQTVMYPVTHERLEERTPAKVSPVVEGHAGPGIVGIGLVVGVVVAIVSSIRKGKRT